jgi:hypothetical protein
MVFRSVAVCMLFLFLPVAARMQLGFDLYYDINPNIQTSDRYSTTLDTRTQTTNVFPFKPYLGIRPGDLVEITPSVDIRESSTSLNTTYTGSTPSTNTSITNWGLGAGCGVLFHVVRGSFADLVLGPDLSGFWWFPPSQTPTVNYSAFYSSVTALDVPVACDFHIANAVGIRMGMKLFSFTYTTHSITVSGGTPDVDHDFDIALVSSWMPSVGIFFAF